MHQIKHVLTLLSLSCVVLLSSNSYALETKADLLLKTRGLAQMGNYKDAVVELNKIIEIDAKDPQIYMMRAFSYNKVDQTDSAIADYSKVIELDSKNANAYYNRAYSHLLKKEFDLSWSDIHKTQSLGMNIDPKLLEDLKKASGKNE